MNTPGIVDVPELNVKLDTSANLATVDFIAIYEDGSSLPGFIALII